MKLTPRQRYQILFVVIEEIQRLAQKFGLNDGLEALQIFRESAEIKKQGDLVILLEEETEESKTENLLSKTAKNNEDKLLRIMGEIFTIKMHSTSNELKQVINLTEKELKKLSKSSSGGLDSEALNDYVKVSIKNYIKLKFGVSRKDIREARTQLEKRWGEKSEKSLSATSSCARVSLLLLQDKKAQNFNYHGIKINGLYKLIKIVNGIENQEVARSFLPFFSEDSVEHRQVIRAFFAVEKTSQYCRLPTMLVQILSSLVANNPDYEQLAERFVTNILKQPDKTSIDSLLDVPNAESTALLFHDLFESTLSISAQFNHILAVAKINLAEREPHIQALNSTQDIFLRSVYFFCFVSPLLELVETRLKRQDLWNIKDIQQLRLELSMAFHVLLGMNSNLGKNNSISKPPLLMKLVMNDTLLEKVTCSFAVIGEIAGSQLTETDSSCTTSTPFDSSKYQHTLFSVKPQSSKLALESHSSSSGKKTGTVAKNKGKGVASSSNSEEHVATKRGVYSSTKTMSFYSSSQKMSDSSSPSISSGVIERSRKRSQSSLSEKKSMSRGISTSKIPLLPISKIIHEDDSLELYFNHLFDCDPMIATEFVLSLARPKDKTKLSWGIRVLNEASGKFCQHIAVVLLNHLSEPELLMLVAQLYQLETGDSWCRGNKLLPLLIQHYLEHEDRKEYKKMVWEAVFALADSLRSIDLTQCESDTFTVELFKAEQTDIEAVQQHFLSALNTILSPKQFPAFIQGIAQLGYADLKRREELDSSEHVLLCKLIAFILIRVINPIISQEAQLLKESVLKQWYLGTIPAAIQSLTSPLVNPVESSSTAVRDLIFGAITKDIQQRNKIYMMMAAELHVGSIAALPLDSESSLARDHENCKYVLNEMLKQEQFSGLHFKANGTVTPSRNTSKPPVLSFFESGSHESLAFGDSTAPRKGGGTQLLETVIDDHVDNGDCTSSSGTTGSPRANSSI